MQWSYDLLTPAQQRLFEITAVFTAPVDLHAVEVVAGGPEEDRVEIDRLLGDLVERSMVSVEVGTFGHRFRMVETLRHFAIEQLEVHGAADAVAERHAHWCRAEVAHIGAALAGTAEVDGVARLAALWPNLRSAFEWACNAGDHELADALVRPVAVEIDLRRQAEIGDWAERILGADTGGGHRPHRLLAPVGGAPPRASARPRDLPRARTSVRARRSPARPLQRRLPRRGRAGLPRRGPVSRSDGCASGANSTPRILIEISGRASSLMTTQRFAELAELAAELAERHRLEGPPTLWYFALGMQGYAAQYQGQTEDAASRFGEAEAVELPAGTYRVVQTATSRIAFERGDHERAYRGLRDNIDGVLDSDYTDVTRMIAVEFIAMMGVVGRLAAAARVLSYLDTTGDYGILAREHLVADVVRLIDGTAESIDLRADPLNAHDALVLMRSELAELLRPGASMYVT